MSTRLRAPLPGDAQIQCLNKPSHGGGNLNADGRQLPAEPWVWCANAEL